MSDLLLMRKKLIVYDGFNRADNASSLGNADTGQVWSASGFGIVSNKGHYVINTNNAVIATLDGGVVDVFSAQAKIKYVLVGGSAVGVACRTDGTTDNRITAMIQTSTRKFLCTKSVSGTSTVLGSIDFSPIDGVEYTIKIEVNGNTFACYVDGILKIQVTDDNALKTNTKQGIVLYNGSTLSTITFDDFRVEAI